MVHSTEILNARHIGIRDLKIHLSEKLRSRRPLVITEHGKPKKIILSYQDTVEMFEMIEELRDNALHKLVRLSRSSPIHKAIDVSAVFGKIRSQRKTA
ncbi:MAG: type II toxin-antitoxin system Phd/YefM family antitoxin [Candidatus Omnitrophica bacterium]|nr:type II toxin-antitoxin system Phd/YefM family antitoxin [Candidatus Omnitrophota bacterium]